MTCPACGSDRLRYEDALSWCMDCDHAFQTDLKVTVDYSGEYGTKTYDTYPLTTAYLRAGYVFGALAWPPGGTILDVGYGNGAFLKIMAAAGWTARGVDVHGRDYGIVEAPIDTPCTVATFFDSLEHFPDLGVIGRLIAPHVIVSVPCRPSWARGFPTQWKHYKPGEHMHYFSQMSMRLLFKRFSYLCADENAMEDTTRGKLLMGSTPFDNIRTYRFERA